MDLKHTRITSIILILLCIVGYTLAVTIRDGEERESEEVPIVKPSLWEIFKKGFSLYSSSPWKVTSYSDKVKSLGKQLHACFVAPNVDFRGTSSSDDDARVDQPSSSRGGGDAGGGAGEKMKKVVSKSFGKSKETVEDTAKSAAKAVGETVQKTKEKVKIKEALRTEKVINLMNLSCEYITG